MLQRFGECFAGVLGGRDISLSAWDLLDTLVCEVESSLGVEGEVCDEPSLHEVVECITALYNAVALGVDGIIALLLKARLEPTAWSHRGILAVWRNGKALEAWKSTLVIPMYKGKGSHQCMNN